MRVWKVEAVDLVGRMEPPAEETDAILQPTDKNLGVATGVNCYVCMYVMHVVVEEPMCLPEFWFAAMSATN